MKTYVIHFQSSVKSGLNQAMNKEAGLEDNLPPHSQSVTLSAYMNKGVYKPVPLKPRADRQYQDETQVEREQGLGDPVLTSN